MSLTRYVPRLSAEWEMHSSQPWREIDGTLCYIDISGFTALSEKLARRGRIGAEELTEVLNFVFGKMLGVAYDRGGSLLKFGGDALLLIFTGSDHPVQAASAAVEMQAVLREARSYETSAGRLSLKMSVGLHTGMVHLFRVGDSHKELILTGPAASMTTEMEETASAGEILISSSTKAALDVDAARGEKGEGWLLGWRKARIECCGWSARAQLDPAAVAESIPMALRGFLEHGVAEPEHHIATVGFIKYQGVDALMEESGPTAVAEALDELVRNVQHSVEEEGVTFLASDIDQDGGKIIIAAGVPGVQEDDEGRVLRAARRISDSSGVLQLRIGVNQGHVFVGEVGTDFRATYTIMGDTVNLAARLMAAASPGEVYASPSALDRSLTLFETTPLEPFYVKGKERPVQAYSVGATLGNRPSRRGGELQFVGRSDELSRLNGIIDDLFRGKGNAVAICGERGIGKSRLVDEVLPGLERATYISMRAEPYGRGTPYRPLRDPVRRFLGIQRDEPEMMAQSLNEALTKLVPEHAMFAPLLADVAIVDMPSTPEVDQIDPKFRQDRTADLLVELFDAVCSGPVLFEVEDGHHMDEASSHVMQRIAAATADHPWLVLTTREDTGEGFDPSKEEISLGPLSGNEASQLVKEATAAAPLRPHDIDEVVRRGGGLPLYLEEIIGAVRAAGGVDSLPDSLDAVVSSQIDSLTPLARRILRFASVLGLSFRNSIINQLLEVEGSRLDSATRRELAGFLDADGSDRLRFRHAMIRDVAYGSLSFKRRRDLHIRLGELIESAAGNHPESAADVLALHFSIGQDHERAWRYSRIAGDEARETYANVEAAGHYERALEAVRRLPDVPDAVKAGVWTALGDVRARFGNFDESLNAYRSATSLVRGDSISLARLAEKRARVRERSGRYDLALRETTSGYRILRGINSSEAARIRAQLSAFAANIRMAQQNLSQAKKQALIAAQEAELSGEKAALASAYSDLDLYYRWTGQPEKAVYGLSALAIYEELGDLNGQGKAHGNMGVEAYFDGRWDDAVEQYGLSRDAFRKTGNEVQAVYAEANMAEVLVNQGRTEEAKPLLEDAHRVFLASEWLDGASFVEVQLARVLAGEGDIHGAIQLFEKARNQYLELGEIRSIAELVVYLAECYLDAGEAGDALRVLDQAEGVIGSEAAVHSAGILRVRGMALSDLGDPSGAAQAVEAGLVVAEEQGLTYDIALLLLIKARLDQPADEKADATLIRALQMLDELGVKTHPELIASS